MPDATQWLRKLGALNVSRSKAKGPAPNKPLLVLAILDLAEEGLIGPDGLLRKDVQLHLRFRNYSPICAPRRGNKIDLDLPWEHLASDGLYRPPPHVQGVSPALRSTNRSAGLTPLADLRQRRGGVGCPHPKSMRSLILALFACLSAFADLRANDLDMAGLDTPRDKTAAANRLLLWTRSLGYDAVLSQDGEDVFIKELKLTISPVLNDDNGIDRLVIYNAYAGKPGNFGNKELTDVVTAINADQIAAQVSVLRTGSVLFVTYVSFDDKLSPILFRKFLEHSNRMAEVIINANPQLAKFIK